MTKVFLSYAQKDQAAVQKLVEKLKGKGFELWTDREVRPGENLQHAIETALDESSALLLFVSPDFLSSKWQQIEVGMSLSSGKKIIPVLVGGATPPPFLSNDFTLKLDPGDEERVAASIAKAVETTNR